MSSPSGRKIGFSDRWRRLSDEVPVKSHFDQVHQASGFGAFELSQNLFEELRGVHKYTG
jgi:hypothetical protein